MDRELKILEVGSNIGLQLRHLHHAGFKNLTGLELQRNAVEEAKMNVPGVDFIQGSALDLPFKDNSFDLVFTSGVLIHIAPEDLETVIKEITRVSRKYIWGLEYYSDTPEALAYRGHDGFMWKRDFSQLYKNLPTPLELIKERKYNYLENDNVDQGYLFEKK